MSDDRDWGGLWLVGYAVAMGVAALIALLSASCAAPKACPPVERVIVRVVERPCLQQKPPAPMPHGASDAQFADAYVVLRRWADLYALPACAE